MRQGDAGWLYTRLRRAKDAYDGDKQELDNAPMFEVTRKRLAKRVEAELAHLKAVRQEVKEYEAARALAKRLSVYK